MQVLNHLNHAEMLFFRVPFSSRKKLSFAVHLETIFEWNISFLYSQVTVLDFFVICVELSVSLLAPSSPLIQVRQPSESLS